MDHRFIFLLSCLTAVMVSGDVLRFQPQNQHNDITDYIKSIFDFSKIKSSLLERVYSGSFVDTRTGRVGKYMFKNCGDPTKDVFDLTYLNISPDPLQFPGTLVISFTATAHQDINSPIRANVTLAQKDPSGKYNNLPCIANFGSCVYTDLCAMLAQVGQCPPPLEQAGIKCKCPIAAGDYTLKEGKFDIEVPLLQSGSFMGLANMTSGSISIGCYEIYVDFA